MQRSFLAWRTVQVLAALLVGKTIVAVLLLYPDYFPPNFRAVFLLGRSEYFFGPYQWDFYTHILAGPFTLIAGLVLLSESFRRRFPRWHRRLGRIQVFCVLFLLTPSGMWMARYAMTSSIAAAGFATLAIVTAVCVAKGWRAATQRQFAQHRRWMLRCYILLCSAVVQRIIGGFSEVFGIEGIYPYAAWLSWVAPLFVIECVYRKESKT